MATIPDGTVEGGNCRGENATDWQSIRNLNTQVASGNASTIGGGRSNTASDSYSTVGGGISNTASGINSTVGGGNSNTASGLNSTVGGGNSNTASGTNSTIGGGILNTAFGDISTVGGGANNTASGIRSTVGGGASNTASGNNSVISGGTGNIASGHASSVSGGEDNRADGFWSSISGGQSNRIQASANHAGTLAGQGLNLTFAHSSAVGRYNLPGDISGSERLFMVGYGDSFVPGNLFSVTIDGNAHASGSVSGGGADFAEFFESTDGERIPVGTPVVFTENSRTIEPAKDGQVPFGVISATGAFIGNASDEEWIGKYERDEHGAIIWENYEETIEEIDYEEKEVTVTRRETDYTTTPPSVKIIKEKQIVQTPRTVKAKLYDEEGKELGEEEIPLYKKVTRMNRRKRLSKTFNPKLIYIPRIERKEWNIVGLVGVVRVLKGTPTNPRWVKIKEEDEKYDLYLLN
jgi:hypothetical protein